MSAICGFVNLDGMPASVETGSAMMDKLGIYHADTSRTLYDGQAFLGCHLQWITPESYSEALPYHDSISGMDITADAIIDNRQELFDLFGIPLNERDEVSDSRLILMAYQKWGVDCPKHLVGDYAVAIWDSYKKKLFCARDHVGKRTFYYVYNSGVFAFCTVMKPLLVLPQVEGKLNNLWIADFLAIPSVAHELDPNHTVYQDIFQLAPAHSMSVSLKGLKKQKFWDPLRLPELRLKSDAEYDEAFREVFFEAVHCRTRSIGSVGVMLSGGLDSGAVACVAARQLKKNGKRLKAFSALPMEGYKEHLPSGYISDESEYIEAVMNKFENIDVTFCRSQGKDSLTDAEKFISILEQPYKTVENLFWIDTIAEKAVENDCKVLLDGQFGNSTISFGDFYIHTYTLFRQGRFIKLLDEITGYSRLHGLRRRKFAQYVLQGFFPEAVQKYIFKVQGGDIFENKFSLICPELAKQYNTEFRLKRAGYNVSSFKKYTLNEIRSLTISSSAFSHIGAVETKLSLAYGIAKRDPTRDKRLIDFCFRIPGDQYVREGRERFLIRRSMQGIMPDKVRLNWKVRGRQSADWVQRLLPRWNQIRNELREAAKEKSLQRYINSPGIQQALSCSKDLIPGETNELDLRLMLICLIFSYFIKDNQEVS